MDRAGYNSADIIRIKEQLNQYVNLREIIRKASGESLDLKAYEADMRHLIDTYIEADEPRKISPFDNMGLMELIVKTGIANAIATQLGGLKAVGNIDSYTGYGPDSVFLSNTAETFYTQFVSGTVDRRTFLNTFTSGGYYSAQPLGPKLMVIGLNTNPFALGVPGDNDGAVATELTWLDSTLASAQSAGQEVWLLMHVPPGVNTVSTAANIVSGQPVSATMMMYQSYQTSFLQVLAKYPGVITMTLGAHTHMDEYRILSPSVVLDEVPAISPCFGENPAFKVFTISQSTFTPIDYSSLNYDLAVMPAQFNSYYTFSAAYSMQGPLGASLVQLYPELATNVVLTPPAFNAEQALYEGQYLSEDNLGKTSKGIVWNPTLHPPRFEAPIIDPQTLWLTSRFTESALVEDRHR